MDDEFGTFYKIKLLYTNTILLKYSVEKVVEYHLSKKNNRYFYYFVLFCTTTVHIFSLIE